VRRRRLSQSNVRFAWNASLSRASWRPNCPSSHRLRRTPAGQLGSSGSDDSDKHERLAELKVELDQCWDLLRQREAREEFGQDPDEAAVRDAGVVEGYEQ
jgi:hypothetical protein